MAKGYELPGFEVLGYMVIQLELFCLVPKQSLVYISVIVRP
jgi:hypothetical protein